MSSTFMNHPIIMSLGWTLIHSFWIALAFALIVRIVWLRIGAKQAIWRYRIGLLAMSGLFLSALFIFGHYFQKYQTLNDPTAAMEVVGAEQIALYPSVGSESGTSIISTMQLVRKMESFFPVLVIIWAFGAFIMGFRLTGSWWYLRLIEKGGLTAPDEHWNHLFSELCTKMGIRGEVRLFWSDRIREPITLRHLKPIVLFPLGLVNQLTMDQVEVILLHELSHIRRWDYLVNWLQALLELLFFFHPAVWWLSAQVRTAREHCCDDLVLQVNRQQRMLYARTLTQVSAYSINSKTKLVMSLNGNNNEFTARIMRLFGKLEPDLDWRKPFVTCCLAMLLLAFGLFYSSELTANAGKLPLQEEVYVTGPDTIPVSNSDASQLEIENPTREPMILLNGAFIGYGAPAIEKIDTSKIATVNEIGGDWAMIEYGKRARYGAIDFRYKSKAPKTKVRPTKVKPVKGAKIKVDIADDAKRLGDGKPLIVLDGEVLGTDERHLKKVDPELIEKINVLKGPDAIKEYGKKGQNGVIEIISKKEIIKVSKKTNGMDVGADFPSTKFFFGPAGNTQLADPLVIYDGEVLGRKSKVEDQVDHASIELLTYSGPTENLIKQFGAEAKQGVIKIISKVNKMNDSESSLPESDPGSLQQELTNNLQIFPNPFQDQIQINYLLPRELNSSLQVFDAQGRLVKELATNALRIGQLSVTWDASDVPSGTYFIVLEADGKKARKSVIKK